MFDIETTDLIKTAIPLEGQTVEMLPQFLTQAYSTIIAARFRFANPSIEFIEDAEWSQTISKLQSIAETYEGLTIFLADNDEHRMACAFVAGSSYFTLNQSRRVSNRNGLSVSPSLTNHIVSSEVSACLLFLIGGHLADAAEAAKTFNVTDSPHYCRMFLLGVAAIATGNGKSIREYAFTDLEIPRDEISDNVELATNYLWYYLSVAVQYLCQKIIGEETDNDPIEFIKWVIEITTSIKSSITIGENVAPISLPNEGPFHIAKLLKTTAESLLTTAVVNSPCPTSVTNTSWHSFLKSFALNRPFLWKNHLGAISNGFLDIGKSFVLTFPTGAGKSTLTELRIAAEILRNRAVIYIVPTRALVDHVAKNIKKTLAPISRDILSNNFLEDFGERAEAKVYVQTPEQCLSYLSHDTTVHCDIGLIIIDECHQISGISNFNSQTCTPRMPNRRSIDAMWCLLSLFDRSTEADIVLISAMVRNGEALSQWLGKITGRSSSLLDLQWKPTRQVRGFVAYDALEISNIEQALRQKRSAGVWTRRPSANERRDCTATPIGIFCHTQVWDTNSPFSHFPLLIDKVSLSVNNYWRLTSNRNEVASRLLANMVKAKVPSLVFTQQIRSTKTIGKNTADELIEFGVPPVAFTPLENQYYSAAAVELGNNSLVEMPINGLIGIHHGLLLSQERHATESAFSRPGGIPAIVATPTVAQGINLPAEAVIIAGDDRWNENSEESAPEILEAHELLNAAGRAGRAGHFANGIVIDIPGSLHTVSRNPNDIELSELDHVMSIFGLPDQCFDVVDPLIQILDRISSSGVNSNDCRYFIHRTSAMNIDTLRRILLSSLGNATNPEKDAIVDMQISTIQSFGRATNENNEEQTLWESLSVQMAVSPEVIAQIIDHITDVSLDFDSLSFRDIQNFVVSILLEYNNILFGLIDPYSSDISKIIPSLDQEEIVAWENRCQIILKEVLNLWCAGNPIMLIGEKIHHMRNATNHIRAIDLGRRFSIRVSASIGYGASIICKVINSMHGDALPLQVQNWLQLVPGALREGYDNPDKLLLYWILKEDYGDLYPRVIVHNKFEEIKNQLPIWIYEHSNYDRRAVVRDIIRQNGL